MSTSLYRCYDSENMLLYVGISLNVINRLRQHEETSHWWKEIQMIQIQHFASREKALEAEQQAIQKENPLFNKMLSQDKLLPRQKKIRWHDGLKPRFKTIWRYPEE